MRENNSDKLLLNVRDVKKVTGLSRSSIYAACARGDLPAVRIGRRILIPKHALQRFLEEPQTLKPASTAFRHGSVNLIREEIEKALLTDEEIAQAAQMEWNASHLRVAQAQQQKILGLIK